MLDRMRAIFFHFFISDIEKEEAHSHKIITGEMAAVPSRVEYNLKGLYIPTYDSTSGPKQAAVGGKSKLFYSDVVKAPLSSDLSASMPEVSVRECMLFLLSKCKEPGYICPW